MHGSRCWVYVRECAVGNHQGKNRSRWYPAGTSSNLAVAASPDRATCVKVPDIKTEEWVVDPKTKGIRDVWV